PPTLNTLPSSSGWRLRLLQPYQPEASARDRLWVALLARAALLPIAITRTGSSYSTAAISPAGKRCPSSRVRGRLKTAFWSDAAGRVVHPGGDRRGQSLGEQGEWPDCHRRA